MQGDEASYREADEAVARAVRAMTNDDYSVSLAVGTRWSFRGFCPASSNKEPYSMKILGIAYIRTLVSFLLFDGLWLGVVAKTFYRDQLGDLMSPNPNLAVAALFYLVFAAAIIVLAVRPGLEAGTVWAAVGYGAVLGFAAYGTYDLTNLATLKGWPVPLSIVDLIWGTVLTSVASAFGFASARYFV